MEGVFDDNLGNPIGLAGGQDVTPIQAPIEAPIEVTTNAVIQATITPTPITPTASHWLTAGLSKQDTVSRLGSLVRTSRIEKDYLENVPEVEVYRTSEGQV